MSHLSDTVSQLIFEENGFITNPYERIIPKKSVPRTLFDFQS